MLIFIGFWCIIYTLEHYKGGITMDNLCNCHDCDRSFRHCIENLDFLEFKLDIKNYCSKCTNPDCLNHEVYEFLCLNFPKNTFTKEYLLDPKKFPKELRPGICNYMAEKHYWE